MIPEVARPSRRSVVGAVAAGAAGALGGCSGSAPSARRGAAPAPSPGAAQRAQAARDSVGLLARYDAVAAAHPGLASRLAPLRAEVARHVQAFGGRVPAPRPPRPSGPSGPVTATTAPPGSPARPTPGGTSLATAPPTTAPPATAPSTTPAAALADLAAAERALADRRATALLTVPGDLARLMASVAAAGAGHAALLTAGGPRQGSAR